MVQESTNGTNLSRKATLLMAEILQLANKVLPLSIAANIQVRRTISCQPPLNLFVRLCHAFSKWPRITTTANIGLSVQPLWQRWIVSTEIGPGWNLFRSRLSSSTGRG